jgi:transcriptional regulator with XRE-family HTH domain
MRKIPARETRLRAVLREEGRKQRWLAQLTGISEVQVSRFVTGRVRPSARDQERIASVLGRRVGELFPPADYPRAREETAA